MDYLPLVDPVEKQMLSSSLFLEYKYQSTRASKDSVESRFYTCSYLNKGLFFPSKWHSWS